MTIIRNASAEEILARELERGIGDLAVLPKSAYDALQLAQTVEPSVEVVAAAANRDPVLMARLLAVANSTLYARAVPIVTAKSAFIRIGNQAARDVFYQVAYSAMLGNLPSFKHLASQTFNHGVLTSRIARSLASFVTCDAQMTFLAGLLHDVGKSRCLRILAKRCNDHPLREIVTAMNRMHAIAGSELAAAWRLPIEVVETCQYHHDPGPRVVPAVVCLANELAHVVDDDDESDDAKLSEAIERLELPASHKDALLDLGRSEQNVMNASVG